VYVEEPSIEDTIAILKGLRERYEEHHQVRYDDAALEAAARLAARYITDRFLPDKAIDLMDEAGSKKHLQAVMAPPEINELEAQIARLEEQREAAALRQDYQAAATFKQQIEVLRAELEERHRAWEQQTGARDARVTEEDIAQIDLLFRAIAEAERVHATRSLNLVKELVVQHTDTNLEKSFQREKTVSEITSKIRSTNDPAEMLQIALDEIKQALKVKDIRIVKSASAQEK
jgi:ATP-dependent Clp protease ATP-binding subunit ClpA